MRSTLKIPMILGESEFSKILMPEGVLVKLDPEISNCSINPEFHSYFNEVTNELLRCGADILNCKDCIFYESNTKERFELLASKFLKNKFEKLLED